MRYDVTMKVRGEPVATHLHTLFPTLTMKRFTPDYTARKIISSEWLYHLDGTLNAADLTRWIEQVRIAGTTIQHIAFGPQE